MKIIVKDLNNLREPHKHLYEGILEKEMSRPINNLQTSTLVKLETEEGGCDFSTQRECVDGSCVLKSDLCDEEEILNQNTILIMIVIGMAVVLFLIILYCFQKKTRTRGRSIQEGTFEAGLDDGDNASLYNPPPTYDEVITTNLYPPTPQPRRAIRLSSSEEPITPPPNYQAALSILAQSHESVLINKTQRTSQVFRRSVSVDSVQNRTNSTSGGDPTTPTARRLPSIGQ